MPKSFEEWIKKDWHRHAYFPHVKENEKLVWLCDGCGKERTTQPPKSQMAKERSGTFRQEYGEAISPTVAKNFKEWLQRAGKL